MSQKLQIAIYRIESGHTLDSLCEKAQLKKFVEQSLSAATKDGFQLKLFYQSKPSYPKWKGFAESIAAANTDILQKNKSRMEGFVLFLSKANKLYAITGGHGHFVVQDCIDNDFGIEMFSRLIKKEDKILKSAKEKSLVGGVLGMTKYFRKNFNLFDNDGFGKIYQELKASLNKDILINKLGFTEEDIKKDSLCVAKSSFRINKDISFDQLTKLIKGCESILESEQPVLINSVEKLSKKKDQALIEKLYDELINQLWRRYSQPQDSVDFDICDYEWEKYLTASHYIVMKGTKNAFGDKQFEDLSNVDILFEAIKTLPKQPADKAAFEKLVRNLQIFSYDDEGEVLTQNPVLVHLLGDVPYNGKRYFFIDRSWYLIKDTFIETLNEYCNSFIHHNYIDKLEKSWAATLPTENDYNAQYIGAPQTIVLDKITPENIEPCDIMRWDDNTLYLCHVKEGFGNTMRDLCSQVTIAAHRIQQDLKADKAYIKKIYQSLKSKKGGEGYYDKAGKQTDNISEADFVKLFDKKIVYVLAVLDTATGQRDIKKMESFNSNIAKFSLQELSKDMRNMAVGFSITQLTRPAVAIAA